VYVCALQVCVFVRLHLLMKVHTCTLYYTLHWWHWHDASFHCSPACKPPKRQSFSRTKSAGSSGGGVKTSQISFKRAKSSFAKMECDDELALIEAQFTGELCAELRAEAAARPASIEPRDCPEEEAACPSGPGGRDLNGAGKMGSSISEIQPEISVHGSQIGPEDWTDSPKPSEVSERVSFRTMVDGRDVERTEFANAGVILVVKSSAVGKPEELAEVEGPAIKAEAQKRMTRSSRKSIVVLISGVCQAQFGMIMFNLGLNFGFTSLGNQVCGGLLLPVPPIHPPSITTRSTLPLHLPFALQHPGASTSDTLLEEQVGTLLPAAFIDTPKDPASPYYSFNTG
jgi:hypothetical protein